MTETNLRWLEMLKDWGILKIDYGVRWWDSKGNLPYPSSDSEEGKKRIRFLSDFVEKAHLLLSVKDGPNAESIKNSILLSRQGPKLILEPVNYLMEIKLLTEEEMDEKDLWNKYGMDQRSFKKIKERSLQFDYISSNTSCTEIDVLALKKGKTRLRIYHSPKD